MRLSVILCTHDPRPEHLHRSLAALRAQTLPFAEWELLLIDNASSQPVSHDLLAWHPQGHLVREEKLGLTVARARGIAETRGELLVFCDDDNLLQPDYLAHAVKIFAEHPNLGAAGGKSLAAYASPPPAWIAPFTDRLAVRDLGDKSRLTSWIDLEPFQRTYPAFAPIGAGLILSRQVAREYVWRLETSPLIPDRVGRDTRSGGDCDMVLTALELGFEIGYFPALELTHLIPSDRLELDYLARLNRRSSESWVQVLARHGIFPWTPVWRGTAWLRQARAFFAQQAWRGPAHYFRWAGACGLIAGRAKISRLQLKFPADRIVRKDWTAHTAEA